MASRATSATCESAAAIADFVISSSFKRIVARIPACHALAWPAVGHRCYDYQCTRKHSDKDLCLSMKPTHFSAGTFLAFCRSGYQLDLTGRESNLQSARHLRWVNLKTYKTKKLKTLNIRESKTPRSLKLKIRKLEIPNSNIDTRRLQKLKPINALRLFQSEANQNKCGARAASYKRTCPFSKTFECEL